MVAQALKDIIERNGDTDFVFHIRTQAEQKEIIDLLESMGYEFCLPFLGTLTEMAAQFAEEDGCDGCWRISRERGVAYNPSIEHWRAYGYDIIEWNGEKIVFNEGYLTAEDAETEARKMRQNLFGEDKDALRGVFDLGGSTDEEIEAFIKKMTEIKP